MLIFKVRKCLLFCFIFLSIQPANAEIKHAHDEHEDEHSRTVQLTEAQIRNANIVVSEINPERAKSVFFAPAEIVANRFKTQVVAPIVDSVVRKRHVALGETVKPGQPLVTLFSAEVARAQADYVTARAQWQRMQGLQTSSVSEKQKSEAKTEFDAAKGILQAYGLKDELILSMSSDSKYADTLGEYTLYASLLGSVLEDNLLQGQHVESGDVLLSISNERTLWANVFVSPSSTFNVNVGTPAVVIVNGETYPSHVIQTAHMLDSSTRTRIVRLQVDNPKDRLHAGMYAEARFTSFLQHKQTVVPESALMSDATGNWSVFMQLKPGVFSPLSVKRGEEVEGGVIITGLPENISVVTSGAFFIASELNKVGFDPHNH
ncbi:efflux RND transporter periplasmic adaptor subunit [Aestuariibacter sp. AA17]|uniref:Efflux RND transporter periplasmic adaptor subunit n=1 Tax=Fluctibacter corallii TaxID=2984329 RepID=A0ABT3A4W1_9ALTE|nr:efflux RND transporter periplasmic adaptor subunit [Aestuariibacter sp. AA17]MCV2883670.1 efflux RND transporter periplasmic adaptor subunit [Aestuariibacter sp. AA17]